jgi:hypothetical protein
VNFIGVPFWAISLLWETAKIPGTPGGGLSLTRNDIWRNPAMATENNPNDAYDRDHLREPLRTHIGERRSPADIDSELQVDPEMAEGPASNTRIALFAVGIAIVLGVVFYALNNTSMQQQASTVPTPANSQSSPPAAPRANSQPGTTTGSAPANPQAPSPASTAPGGTNTNTATLGNASGNK